MKEYSVIDLFCGVGGLTHGFIKEKFNVVAGIDFDLTCEYAFEKNNEAPFIHKDITKITPAELESYYPKKTKKILVGCAPCQPFSVYNHKNNNNPERQKEDTKWALLYSFADLVEATAPEIISMENVPQLLNFNKGKVFNDFVERLEKCGYNVSYSIVNAQDYGVPQRRKRLILFGTLGKDKIEILPKTHDKSNYFTVRKAIKDLPPIKDGEISESDPLHRARELTPLNRERIRATKEGGSWKDWDSSLWLDCHKKESGKSFGSVYGRMKWDDVAPTMTTYCVGLGNGRFGHPEQDRAISLREAAIFQSFPEYYDFIDPENPLSTSVISRQIGNAVPVKLGEVIAQSIKIHLEKYSNE